MRLKNIKIKTIEDAEKYINGEGYDFQNAEVRFFCDFITDKSIKNCFRLSAKKGKIIAAPYIEAKKLILVERIYFKRAVVCPRIICAEWHII